MNRESIVNIKLVRIPPKSVYDLGSCDGCVFQGKSHSDCPNGTMSCTNTDKHHIYVEVKEAEKHEQFSLFD